MESNERTAITVQVTVDVPVETAWKSWTSPADIVKWNNASDDWHTTKAEINLREGGSFLSRMEAKDGSMGFDFGGIFEIVRVNERISYLLGDGRKVNVVFSAEGDRTGIVETFDAENVNPLDHQRFGWQCILDNFKKYTESQYR